MCHKTTFCNLLVLKLAITITTFIKPLVTTNQLSIDSLYHHSNSLRWELLLFVFQLKETETQNRCLPRITVPASYCYAASHSKPSILKQYHLFGSLFWTATIWTGRQMGGSSLEKLSVLSVVGTSKICCIHWADSAS